MKKTALRNYARLIVRTGVNVQKGQEVFVQADLDQPEFVAMVVEEAYRAGAKRVVVDWSYQPLRKINVRHQSLKVMGSLSDWERARLQHYTEELPCRIYLISDDPDGLRGINQVKLAKAQMKLIPIIKPYRDKMENRYQWCIAAVPGKAWAKKLFPEKRASQAVEALWEAILKTSRADGDDPAAAWQAHNETLRSRCAYLNSLNVSQSRDFFCSLKHTVEECSFVEMYPSHSFLIQCLSVIRIDKLLPDAADIVDNGHHCRKVSR